MALFSPSQSPSVVVKEVDLTGVVPNVQTSTGAFVGNFNWGPVYEPTLISDEAGLVSTFAAPSTTNTVDFHQAAMFLKYSSQLFVVRECDSDARNSLAVNNLTATATRGATSASATNQKIGNLDRLQIVLRHLKQIVWHHYCSAFQKIFHVVKNISTLSNPFCTLK